MSEEDFESVNDGTTPDVIMQNMVKLASALKNMDIKLRKKDVAALISEDPGAAAGLIMDIKSAKEAGGKKQRPATPPYKTATKTVRPKEEKFKRPNVHNDDRSAYQRFMEETMLGKDLSKFTHVHYSAQEAHFHTFKHEQDIKIWEEDRLEEERNLQIRDERIAFERDRKNAMFASSRDVTSQQVERWRTSRKAEHNRKVRDTQYELAVTTAVEYRKMREDYIHRQEQEQGIDAFEINLKRSGIGADDEGGKLSTTYEDNKSFLHRLVETAGKTAPTDEEVGDFMVALKDRTTESRTARYEKVRAQRRMNVEQAASAAAAAANTPSNDGPSEVELMAESMRAAQDKLREKEELIATLTTTCREKTSARADEAEEVLRIFLEQQRMLSYDADDRTAKYEAATKSLIEAERAARVKHEALCGEVVKDLINDILDDDGAQAAEVTLASCDDPVSALLAAVTKSGSLTMEAVFTEDSWLASAILAKGMGRWAYEVVEPAADVPADAQVTATADGEENGSIADVGDASAMKSETTEAAAEPDAEPIVDAVTSADGADHPGGEEGGLDDAVAEAVAPNAEASLATAEAVPPPLATERWTCQDTFSDSAAKALTRLLSDASNPDTEKLVDVVALTPPEITTLGDHPQHILVTGRGHGLPRSAWATTCSAMASVPGGAAIWDVVAALESAEKLAPCFAGKKPAVDFATLYAAFMGGESESCPEELSGTDVDAQAVEAATVMHTAAGKLEAFRSVFEGEDVEGRSAAADALTMPFTDGELAVMLGHSAWLRQWVLTKSSTMPTVTLLSRAWGATADEPVLVRVVDWLLRGGTAANVPEEDEALAEALGGGGGGKKKKGGDDAPAEPALTATIFVVSSPVAELAVEPEAEAEAEVKTVQPEGEEKAAEEAPDADATDAAPVPAPEDARSFVEKCMALYETRKDTTAKEADEEAVLATALSGMFEQLNRPLFKVAVAATPADPTSTLATPNALSMAEAVVAAVVCCADGSAERALEETRTAAAVIPEGENPGATGEAAADAEGSEAALPTAAQLAAAVGAALRGKVQSRRAALTPEETVSWLHMTGLRALVPATAVQLLNTVQQLRLRETTVCGGVAMAVSIATSRVDSELARLEAGVVSALKAVDTRWESTCAEFSPLLSPISAADIASDPTVAQLAHINVSEVVTRLGNTIDERHMNWMGSCSTFSFRANELLEGLRGDMFGHAWATYDTATAQLLASKRSFAEDLASAWTSAGYTQIPWPSSSATSSTTLGLDGTQIASECARTDGDTADLRTAIEAALADETLLGGAALMRSMEYTLANIEARVAALGESLVVRARMRRDYEHRVLSRWMADLKKYIFPATDAQLSSVGTIPAFYAGPDPLQDEISFPKAATDVDLHDMVLEPEEILAMATALRDAEAEGIGATSGCAALLKRACRQLTDRGQVLPTAWRQQQRVESLARSVTGADDGGSSAHVPNFLKAVVMSLILAHFPLGPTTDFVKRIGVVYAGATSPTLEELKRKVRMDTKLQFGWMEPLKDTEAQKAAVSAQISAVEAAATVCLDSDGRVDIDALVLALCRRPTSPSTVEFQSSLALSPGSTRGPSVGLQMSPGFCRALVVAQARRKALMGPTGDAAPSAQWSSLRASEGPSLTRGQLELVLGDTQVSVDDVWNSAKQEIFFEADGETSLKVGAFDKLQLLDALAAAPQPAATTSGWFACLARPL